MKNIFKMTMVSIPLRLKSANLGGGLKMAQDYGREIAEKLILTIDVNGSSTPPYPR